MKISYNWLKQYLKLDLPAEDTAVILTDLGLEVEGIEHHFGKNSLEKIKELIKYLKENNYKA